MQGQSGEIRSLFEFDPVSLASKIRSLTSKRTVFTLAELMAALRQSGVECSEEAVVETLLAWFGYYPRWWALTVKNGQLAIEIVLPKKDNS